MNEEVFIILGCCMVLPICAIWMVTKQNIARDNNRKDILMAALDKNPDVDIEDLMHKLNPPTKLLKEKLLKKLLWGMILSFAGIGLIVIDAIAAVCNIWTGDPACMTAGWGVVIAAIGVGLLVNYNMGKKLLAKEMEAELKNLEKK